MTKRDGHTCAVEALGGRNSADKHGARRNQQRVPSAPRSPDEQKKRHRGSTPLLQRKAHAPPASRDDVIPATLSAEFFGQNVIEAQVVWGEILEAVLALVRVAQKQVASRERRMSPVLVHELLLSQTKTLLNRNDDCRWVDGR